MSQLSGEKGREREREGGRDRKGGREGVLPRWNNTRLSNAYDHAFMRHNADCRMKIE